MLTDRQSPITFDGESGPHAQSFDSGIGGNRIGNDEVVGDGKEGERTG